MQARKAWSILLLLVLVFSITALVTKAAARTKLTLWSGYPEMAPFYQKVIQDYQKTHPGVEISFLTHPLREFEQKVAAALPSNTAADILEMRDYAIARFIDAGLIPSNPSNITSFLKKSFHPAFAKVLTRNGKTYGLPLFQGRPVMFWNKKMFREAGLPGPPTNWDEVIEYAKKLAKYDANGNLVRAGISLRKSGGGSGVAEKWWFWLYPAGGNIVEEVSPGKYRNGYNNEAGRRALQFYIDLLYKYKVDSFDVKSDAEGFELETCAMFIRESWVIGDIKAHAPNLEYGTAPLPRDKRAGVLCNTSNLYVTKTCRNPKIAWDFILFMFKPEYQKFLLSTVGWFPCRIDVDYEEIYKETPQYRAFMELPKGYDLYWYPPLACYDEIQTKLAARLTSWFLDSSLVDNPDKIAKVIAEAAKETDDILKANNAYAY